MVSCQNDTVLVIRQAVIVVDYILLAATDTGIKRCVITEPGTVVKIERPIIIPGCILSNGMITIQLIVDIQTVHTTMRGVAIELTERLLRRLCPRIIG